MTDDRDVTDETTGAEGPRSIIATSQDGLVIELDDGSAWNIDPGDIGQTATWYETQRVEVLEEDRAFLLKNLDAFGCPVARATHRSGGAGYIPTFRRRR